MVRYPMLDRHYHWEMCDIHWKGSIKPCKRTHTTLYTKHINNVEFQNGYSFQA